jgi:hypothetical protein
MYPEGTQDGAKWTDDESRHPGIRLLGSWVGSKEPGAPRRQRRKQRAGKRGFAPPRRGAPAGAWHCVDITYCLITCCVDAVVVRCLAIWVDLVRRLGAWCGGDGERRALRCEH